MNQPASAYFLEDRHDPSETHTLSVLVANEPEGTGTMSVPATVVMTRCATKGCARAPTTRG